MIIGLNLVETVDYSLKKDTENPTVWKIGLMPSYLMAKITENVKNKEIDVAFRLLQLTLKGWENFDIPYETEEEEIFGQKTQVVKMSILQKIPLNAITELSMKAMEVNKLSDEERKN